MEDSKILELGKQKSFPKNGELYQRIRDLVHEYDGEVSTAEAINGKEKEVKRAG